LKKHPYIGYNNALAIIKYREQNGNFNSTEEINKLYSLSEATIEKIKPYITTE
jgi:competence ComEA-like helix-hairpin-helix protein